jgi:hypothetical protein
MLRHNPSSTMTFPITLPIYTGLPPPLNYYQDSDDEYFDPEPHDPRRYRCNITTFPKNKSLITADIDLMDTFPYEQLTNNNIWFALIRLADSVCPHTSTLDLSLFKRLRSGRSLFAFGSRGSRPFFGKEHKRVAKCSKLGCKTTVAVIKDPDQVVLRIVRQVSTQYSDREQKWLNKKMRSADMSRWV